LNLILTSCVPEGWVPRATVLIEDGKTVKSIPIFGRRRASFDTQREADSCAM